MHIYEILPGKLYQSAEFIEEPLWRKLYALGQYDIDCVANVYKHEDISLREELHRYIYAPLADGKNIDPLQVMDIVEEIVDLIICGHRVLVHCHAGRNRSGLISTMVVRELWGVAGWIALEIVRESRPRAVANAAFEEFILNYDN